MTYTETYLGSDCTGNDGTTGRVLTLSNTRTTTDNGLHIVVNNLFLQDTDITVSHKSSGTTITFNNPLWNSQPITVTYEVTGLPTGTTSTGTSLLNTRFIDREIEYLGTEVTLRAVTDSSHSKWGDATESTSDTTKTAFIQVLSQEDELVQEGIFQSGDKLFWFRSSETNIDRGNRIQHNSLWYEIVEVIEHEATNTNFVIEARTKKV